MNFRLIFKILGYILLVEAGCLLLPVIVSLGYGEPVWRSFALISLICAVPGFFCALPGFFHALSGRFCFFGFVSLGKDKNANGFTGSVGKNDCTTDLLFCMTSVASGSDMKFDGLIEFSGSGFLYHQSREG